MKARDLLRVVEEYASRKGKVPEEILQELPEAQLRTAIFVAADLLKMLKTEAVRRGIWDDLTRKKV